MSASQAVESPPKAQNQGWGLAIHGIWSQSMNFMGDVRSGTASLPSINGSAELMYSKAVYRRPPKKTGCCLR